MPGTSPSTEGPTVVGVSCRIVAGRSSASMRQCDPEFVENVSTEPLGHRPGAREVVARKRSMFVALEQGKITRAPSSTLLLSHPITLKGPSICELHGHNVC